MLALSLTGECDVAVLDVAPAPQPAPGELRIAVRGLGLCGSDLSRYLGHRGVPRLPWVVGHEAFGTVTAVGDGVDPSRVGETVVIEPIIGCGECLRCTGGMSAICESRRVLGMTEAGAGSEHYTLPASHAHTVPAEWPLAVLGCIEPLAVAAKAVELADVREGDSVLIIGGGAQGVFVGKLLQARGIRVELSEIQPEKAAFVADLGIGPRSAPDSRYSRVFEASGSAGGWKSALAAVEPGGAIVLVGMGSAPLEFTSEDLVLRQVRVLSSYVYDHPTGFERAINAVRDGAIDVAPVVSAVVPVAEASRAYESALTAPGKVVISFEEWSRDADE
ncbi:zinc-dependent alcohol dehydrogenase [Ruicaihuangia caeni]|uniref:zinc-dependent alcohol dehydrogenase n=1 Tax=Ruicaihuangia caeni TaxID=3042517 RepID=UPI00338D44DF